jgi:hypothetical protein
MRDFVAYMSPARTILLVAGAILFVVLGCWMIGAFGDVPNSSRFGATKVALVGWASIIFFGACGIIGIRRLADKDEQLRISSRGIHWKQWSHATIPWSEILDVSVWSYRRQNSIILVLRRPEHFPSETLLGRFAGMNRALTGGDIAISTTALDRNLDEAMAAIESFRGP